MSVVDISGGYDSFVAEFYDHVVPYAERKDIDFYIELAQKTEGLILEIGCGTGRVLIPIAQAGKDILGFDASQLMLSICRRRLSTEPEAVQHKVLDLQRGDMRHFELHRKFSLITMPFRPFQHLITVEDQQACLANIHRHLEQGGYLAFDIMNPSLEHLIDDKYLNEFNEEPEMSMMDGRKISRRFCIRARNLAEQSIDAEIIYYVTHLNGHTERLVHSFPFRYTFKFELEHLLSRCGFLLHEVYSDFDKSPFGSKYPGELIIVARKC